MDGGAVARGPTALEAVTHYGDRAFCAERLHHMLHLDDALETFALEIGAKIPERQRGVDFALQCFLGQQGRSAVNDRCLAFEIETAAPRERLQEQPALVERAAGYRKLLAPEIGQLPDRRVRRHHHRPERARGRIEHEIPAERALARHP